MKCFAGNVHLPSLTGLEKSGLMFLPTSCPVGTAETQAMHGFEIVGEFFPRSIMLDNET
jgi:hypothetical protein